MKCAGGQIYTTNSNSLHILGYRVPALPQPLASPAGICLTDPSKDKKLPL